MKITGFCFVVWAFIFPTIQSSKAPESRASFCLVETHLTLVIDWNKDYTYTFVEYCRFLKPLTRNPCLTIKLYDPLTRSPVLVNESNLEEILEYGNSESQ